MRSAKEVLTESAIRNDKWTLELATQALTLMHFKHIGNRYWTQFHFSNHFYHVSIACIGGSWWTCVNGHEVECANDTKTDAVARLVRMMSRDEIAAYAVMKGGC